jgi:hypothetical protein
MKKSAKAVRLTVSTDVSTCEEDRTLAYHANCLCEQDPEGVEELMLADAERMGGDEWVPVGGGDRLAAVRASLLRGLPEKDFLYQCTLDMAKDAGHLPKEWSR